MADTDIRPMEGEANDWSCYITIDNRSDSDLLLADFGIVDGYGQWPLYQPLNTIEARSSGRVHLQDPKVKGGSEGWVVYEVQVGGKTETFKLSFDDPQIFWSKNKLSSETSDKNRLQVNVQSYKSTGHPFYGTVEVYTNPNAIAEENPRTLSVHKKTSDEIHANYEIGFDWPGPGKKNPVHENIAIAAFLRSSILFPKATTYNNLNHKQWEYFRGILWNDDPRCLLLKDREDDNRYFDSVGEEWYQDFKWGDDNGMTRRSHFGNLQFLHAMGLKVGEKPRDTCARMLDWMGVMYKLACGNQGVSESDKLKDRLPEHFSGGSQPSFDSSLRDLILATTPGYRWSKIDLRALGVCMHMIQDSYAVGHVQRRLRNPQDFTGRDSKGFFQFRQGTFGQWGEILAFHTYSGQDDDRHSHYDGLEGGDLPDPRDLNSFNRLVGARDAIDACIMLINAFAEKKPWKVVREVLESKVFEIHDDAQDCNTSVDEWPISDVTVARRPVVTTEVLDHEVGHLEKLSALEAGWPREHAQEQDRKYGKWCWQSLVVTILLLMLALSMTSGRLLWADVL